MRSFSYRQSILTQAHQGGACALVLSLRPAWDAVWQDMISGGAYIGDWTAGVLPNIGIKVKDDDYKRFSRGEKQAREDYRRELFEMIDALGGFPLHLLLGAL